MAVRMTKLDAVNICLRALGEQEVPSVLESYPTVSLALQAIEDANIDLQLQEWWFGKNLCTTLPLTQDKQCPCPSDTLLFIPECPKYKWIGDAVVMEHNNSPFLDRPVRGELTSLVEFEKLPVLAQRAVAYGAAATLYSEDVGIDNVYQLQAQRAQQALLKMGGVHTRSRHANSHRKKQLSRFYHLLTI